MIVSIFLVVLFVFMALIIIVSIGMAHAQQPLRIITFGDISCTFQSQLTMTNILNYLQTNHVDAIVFLGDAKYGTSWEDCNEHFFLQVKQFTKVYFVEGNHENETSFSKIADESRQIWNISIGNTLLIGMDTNNDWNTSSAQYKQVVNVLDTTVAEYKLVFMHKNMVDGCRPDRDQYMCGFWELYHPLFKKYKVDCVISGHWHGIAMLNKDGMCYGIYGMGGAQPYALRHSFGDVTLYKSITEHGFVVLQETPTGMMHQFYTNGGDRIQKHFMEK